MLGGIVVILIAIGMFSQSEEKPFSQILTVGPVWPTDSWLCTSDADFMIYGNIRGVGNTLLTIDITESGSQSLYALEEGRIESFSVGASGGQQIIITKDGIASGFITIQTISNAESNCVSI